MSTPKKLYYIEDVERILGTNRQTIYGWERAGKIPKAKREPMSNYRYWTEGEVEKLKKITRRG